MRAAKPFEKFDVAYFMVSVDTPETNKEFAEQEQRGLPDARPIPRRRSPTAYGVLPPVNPTSGRAR